MLNWNIMWVLRFAAFPFFAGLAMLGASGYVVFFYAPAADTSAAWAPAALAFGTLPWLLLGAGGLGSVVWSWRIGAMARRGEI